MATYLQKQLQTRMEAKNLTIYALEKKAGVKRSAARNIIQGFSKKPSAEVLSALANVLECTLDDLIGSTPSDFGRNKYKLSASNSNQPWNEKLFIDAIKAVSKTLNDNKKESNLGQVLSFACETYEYSLSKKSEKVDTDFTNWLVGRG